MWVLLCVYLQVFIYVLYNLYNMNEHVIYMQYMPVISVGMNDEYLCNGSVCNFGRIIEFAF